MAAALQASDDASEAGSFGEWDDKISSQVQGFLQQKCDSPEAAWLELQEATGFDFLGWLRSLQGERMYAYIKLVNFIRRIEEPQSFDWSAFSAERIASDELLQPVVEDDGMLEAYALVDSDEDWSDDDEVAGEHSDS